MRAPQRAVQPRFRLAAGRPVRRLGDGPDGGPGSRRVPLAPRVRGRWRGDLQRRELRAALRTALDRAGPVRLPEAPGADAPAVEAACRQLRQVLPPDVVPYSRAEILRRESDHWVGQTATGKLFAFGVLVATIVAAAVIYQVLSNDVRDHLAEYATLKAMGHSNRYLSRVVIQQALLYAGAAYLIAVVSASASTGRPRPWPASRCGSRREILGLTILVTALSWAWSRPCSPSRRSGEPTRRTCSEVRGASRTRSD